MGQTKIMWGPFFYSLYNCYLYNIYKLHYFYYIFYENPLVPFIFYLSFSWICFLLHYLQSSIQPSTPLIWPNCTWAIMLGQTEIRAIQLGGGEGGKPLNWEGGTAHCSPDVEPPLLLVEANGKNLSNTFVVTFTVSPSC